MRRILVVFLAICISPAIWADSLPNSLRRHINAMVLSMIEDYERCCSVRDDETASEFLCLFEENSCVWNDVLGTETYMTQITPEEYVESVRSTLSYPSFRITDVKKGELYRDGDSWIIPITFNKSVFYVDAKGYVFSTDRYYSGPLEMKMAIKYTAHCEGGEECCRIVSLEASEDYDRKFPKGRFVLLDRDSLGISDTRYFSTLKLDGQSPIFDDGIAFVSSGKPTVNDMDVMITTDTLYRGFNYDVLSFGFRPRKSRMKLRYGYAPFGIYDVMNIDDSRAVRSTAMELGLDFGGMWRMGNSSKMGIFTGFGVSASRVSITLQNPISYSYTTSLRNQETGLYEDLNILYRINSASEGVDYIDFFVPLYFEFEHKAGNFMMITWSVGGKAYYNYMLAAVSQYSPFGSYEVSNTITGQRSVSGTLMSGTDLYLAPLSYRKKPYDISLMANLGFEFNISQKRTYLIMRAGYEYGLTTSYSSGGLPYSDSKNNVFPFVYDPVKNTSRALHSLFSNVTLRRQGIWFEGGFKFKLK